MAKRSALYVHVCDESQEQEQEQEQETAEWKGLKLARNEEMSADVVTRASEVGKRGEGVRENACEKRRVKEIKEVDHDT